MATLTGNAINTSYQGLIKFDDNGTIDATVLKQLTDGTGGSLPIQVSQVQTKFQSLVDFTGATVTGLPASGNLVNGTGADSLKNVDSLVTNATTAGGAQAIALGNGATSSNAQTIAIGNGALSNNFQSVAIGDGAEATGVGAVAMGQYSNANGIYASAWGRTSVASSDGSVAFGQQAEVPSGVAGGVAMGRQVVADTADTTHVRALKIVAPDGGTGGNGITMLSPDGTAGVITLTNASELAVDGTPIGGGGGGGADLAEGQNITPYFASGSYSIPWILNGYSTAAGLASVANKTQFIPFYAKSGESMSEFYVRVNSSQAASTMKIGLYKSYVSVAPGFKALMPQYVATIASDVSTATTGKKLFTGLDIQFPEDAVGGMYWIGFTFDTSGVTLTKWSNWVAAERSIYSDIYRGTGTVYTGVDATLPTGQVDLTGSQGSTDLPIDFAWRYKS